MHAEAMDFCRSVLAMMRPPRLVCELGSRNINGSVRDLLPDVALYVGVDCVAGPGVDVVADASVWRPGSWVQFDLVVCTEVLEHTPTAAAICFNAFHLLRPGGVFLVTAAGPDRPPHSCTGGVIVGDEFYRNVRAEDLREWLWPFPLVAVRERDRQDVYGWAME